MSNNSHLCAACRRVMCPECKEIASEYTVLLNNAKARLLKREAECADARRELAAEQHRRQDLERVLQLGVGPQILAWMDSLTTAQFRAAVEAAAARTIAGDNA